MESILEAINEWIKEILIGAINGNLSTMFGDVNEKVGTIAAEVGKTPQGWNANIFNMIQNLSENVIVPIAGLVITYVLCYELISMVTEKNNMHDIETFMFFKWFFKAFVAVFLVTHTFDITMAVFDMAQHIVSGAAGVIGGDTNIDVTEALAAMQEGLKDMEIPELLLLVMEREFEVLRELLLNQGRVLTRHNLLAKLWKYDFYGDERVVDTHIKNLRKKLGIDFIQTIRGVGYKIDKENQK